MKNVAEDLDKKFESSYESEIKNLTNYSLWTAYIFNLTFLVF